MQQHLKFTVRVNENFDDVCRHWCDIHTTLHYEYYAAITKPHRTQARCHMSTAKAAYVIIYDVIT